MIQILRFHFLPVRLSGPGLYDEFLCKLIEWIFWIMRSQSACMRGGLPAPVDKRLPKMASTSLFTFLALLTPEGISRVSHIMWPFF